MKRKYLDARQTWLQKATYTYHYERIETGRFKGYISYIHIQDVEAPRVIEQGELRICIQDKDYRGVIFLPDDHNWAVTAVYDAEGRIVEWYFDMTDNNAVDVQGVPYFDDLYLDVVVTPTGIPRILDQDELEAAREAGAITQAQYDKAYTACFYVIKEVVRDNNFMGDFLKPRRG